jgi:hypothetical protein
MKKITIQSFWPAIGWFILSTVLFCLPGNVLPEEYWFEIIHLDKWVHIGIFTMMTLLWGLPLIHHPIYKSSAIRIAVIISIVISGYGIVIELVQHYFIPNRTFDVGDIAADFLGCALGFILVKKQWVGEKFN